MLDRTNEFRTNAKRTKQNTKKNEIRMRNGVSQCGFSKLLLKRISIFFLLLLLPNERLCQVLCNRQNLIFDILFI